MKAQTKPLTPVQLRLIEKLKTKGLVVSDLPGFQPRSNPYSGVTVELEPLAAGLCDWIVSPNRGDAIAKGELARNDWDRARYLFLALWPDAFYSLID